jgi:hypothetical protein
LTRRPEERKEGNLEEGRKEQKEGMTERKEQKEGTKGKNKRKVGRKEGDLEEGRGGGE